MKRILFFILFSFTLASAEINEYLSDVYFANGIDTDERTAKKSIENISRKFKLSNPQAYQYVAKWDVSYNHTHGIGIDFYESMLQKIDEHWYTESLLEVSGLLDYSWKGLLKLVAKKVAKEKIKEQAEKYAVQIAEKLIAKHGYVYGGVHLTKDEIAAIFAAGFEYAVEQATDAFLDIPEDIIREQEAGDIKAQFGAYTQSIEDGHGVVVIAHSQGNLFTNLAYDMFENHWIPWEEDTEWMRPYFTAMAVASPATDILGNSQPSITFENDIIQLVPDSMPALEPNPTKYYYTNALGDQIEVKYSMEAHAFLTSYMATNTTRNKILGFINEKVVEQRDNFSTRPSQWKPKNIGCLCKDKYAKMIHKFDPEGMNQYLSNEKVKDFAEDDEGKIYKANTGDHAEYVRALDGDQSDDGIFTIEEVDRDNICYTLKDDASNEIGRIEGPTEPIPQPKSGVVQVTLTWDNPAIDFDLDVGWNAGENDIQDTGCPMEHFYVTSQYDIYPGTYPITVTHKQLDENESALIPEKMQMIIQVPGKTEVYDIDINTVEELEVGHVADIFVKYINNEIVPDISPDPVLTPVISIPTSGGSGGGGYVGGSGSSGGSSGGTPWAPNR